MSQLRLACRPLLAASAVLAIVSGPALAASAPVATGAADAQQVATAQAAYGELPISFEANQGQTDTQVRYLSRGAGYSLFLTPAEAVLSLRSAPTIAETRDGRGNPGVADVATTTAVVRLSFAGANPAPAMQGQERQQARTNYFLGGRSATDVGNFAKVRYSDLYPGIDLLYYGSNQRQLEYDFIVAPGVDPAQIALDIAGVDSLRIDAGGNLVMGTALGNVVQHKPVVYQQIQGRRIEIESAYALQSARQVGFRLGAYDRSEPLVIDPVLVYSTYLGGTLGEIGNDVAVDAAKNAYVTGNTNSAAFPTKGAYQSSNKGGGDIFVAKLGPTGALLYSTYIGGMGLDEGASIAVDAAGAAYITGRTTSVDFPTAAPFQATLGGSQDAFLVKLNAAGNGLVYSTYLGGSSNSIEAAKTGEYGYSVAVDGSGSAYVTGWTVATNFPVVNPLQASGGGVNDDVFVTKFNASGSALVYSTYIGGSSFDEGYGIAVDGNGFAYVTGTTLSTNFPVSAAKQPFAGANGDAFVFKLNPAGNTFAYSTFLGGVGQDLGYGIAVDAQGNAYVGGITYSANFPQATPIQAFNAGISSPNSDAFVTKVSASGNAWLYSTYLGGNGSETGIGVAVDAFGNAFISGQTNSTNYPVLAAVRATNGGMTDGFLSKLSGSGSALVYSTYLGGANNDFANEVAVDSVGDAYVVGQTSSTNFPVVAAHQGSTGGSSDAFVSKISTSTEAVLSVNDVSIAEGNSGTSLATFTATLSTPVSTAVSFNVATGGGSATAGNDYVVASLTGLSIPAGGSSLTFTVAINGDTTVEPNETFNVNLSNVSGALLGDGQGVGTIVNDDAAAALTLSIADVSLAEGNAGTSQMVFTVSLSQASTSNVSFNIATADGTALAGSDYAASSLTGQVIAAGATSKTFSVTIIGDTVTEPGETFFVNLSSPSGASLGDGQAIGNIINDDSAPLPALSIDDVSIVEGNAGTSSAVFTVSLSAVAQSNVTFNIATANITAAAGTDFTAINLPSQVIAIGSSNKTFSVVINGDTAVEANETFLVNISSVNGATVADNQGTGTILNDDSAVLPAISIGDVLVAEGNGGTSIATFTVQLNAVPAGTVSFDIATANGSATAGSDYVALALAGQTIAAGQTSKNFNVTINGDVTVEADETFTVNVGNASGATIADSQAVGTIDNDDIVGSVPPQISVANASVAEGNNGNKSLSFTVSLSESTGSPVSFDIATSNGTAFSGSDYTATSLSTSIPAGQTSYVFSVPLATDTQVEANETFTVNLNNVIGATIADAQGLGTIANDDIATISIGERSVDEGNSGFSTGTYVVTLSMPMPTAVTFDIATSNGTATAGSDYEARQLSGVMLDAGRTRFSFDVKILGDSTAEPNETFRVIISNVTGASVGTASGTQTIANDDGANLTIAGIQGLEQMSPLLGQSVETQGVVTAIDTQGFYLQTPDAQADGDARSAEGIYVSGLSGATIAVGDEVKVGGQVREAQVGADAAQLTQTQLLSDTVTVTSRGQSLPRAIALDAAALGGDSLTALERYEGMRVSIAQLKVVAPSGGTIDERNSQVRGNGQFYGVAGGVARPFLEPGLNAMDRATGVAGVSPQVFDGNPERLLVDSLGQRGAAALSADAGDSVRGLVGVLGYGHGAYRLLPDPGANVSVASAAMPKAVSAARAGEATIGSFNLRRFLDDSRAGNEAVLAPAAYATRLAKTANAICAFAGSPDILGLSEVENRAALGDLAEAVNGKDGNLLFPGSCAGQSAYRATLPANAVGKLGFLVDTTPVRAGVPRVEVLSVSQLGADSRFRQRDGSNQSLHAQAPLLMEARINSADGRSATVTVISAQLSTLDGDLSAAGPHGWSTRGAYLRARRASQAAYLAGLVQSRQAARPDEKLVLLGDFEAAEFSDGHSDVMGVLSGRTAPRGRVLGYVASPVTDALTNLTTRLPAAQRYTVVRQGNAQAVDHILVNAALLRSSPAARAEVARINADFGEDNYADAGVPMRVSDHDPVVLYFDLH